MTQPNIQEGTKQKLQKFYWPLWFPYPSSWLKALILELFLSQIIFRLENPAKLGYRIAHSVNSPELLVLFAILLVLSPIAIISFIHHCLQLLISRFISAIQAPEIGRTQGLFPGIMSWWEGLYAWLVIVISTLIAAFFATIIQPLFNISHTTDIEEYTEIQKNIILIFGLFHICAMALTYQIEYLVRCRIISAYSGNKESGATKSTTDFNTEQELNRLRGEMGLHQMKSNTLSNNIQQEIINNQRNYRRLNKNILVISLISLIAVVTYSYSKIGQILPLNSEIFKQIQSNSVLVTPSPVTLESPSSLPQSDTFSQAVSKAINAANLTQSAKSPDDWKIVVSQWEAAIELMKNVPSSSKNYAVAQQKIIEYQRNLNYAEKNSISDSIKELLIQN